MPQEKTPWIKVRTAYVVNGWSAARCAAEFGYNVTTVKVHAAREGWNAERLGKDPVETAAVTAAVREIRRGVKAAAGARHKADIESVKWLQKIIDDADQDLQKIDDPGERILARSRIAAMVTRIISSKRLVLGLMNGQPSAAGDDFGNTEMPTSPGAPPPPVGDDDTAPAPARRFVLKVHVPVEEPAPVQLQSVG